MTSSGLASMHRLRPILAATYNEILNLRPRWPIVPLPPPLSVCNRLHDLGLWAVCRLIGGLRRLRFERRRGQRAESHVMQKRPLPISSSLKPTSLSTEDYINFGCINVQSWNSKFDDVVDLVSSSNLKVLCLTETWLDIDSAVINRCRCAGYSVIDQPRPRVHDDLSVNHGGVAILAVPGVSLLPLPMGLSPTTFEFTASYVVAHQCRVAVIIVYRPGSQSVTTEFFSELSSLLERLAVLNVPAFVTGDFNVRLDRSDDPHAVQLHSILNSYGFCISTSGPTHRLGGTLDIAIVSH